MPPVVEDGWKLLRVAAWLRDAPPTAGWRVEVFRRLDENGARGQPAVPAALPGAVRLPQQPGCVRHPACSGNCCPPRIPTWKRGSSPRLGLGAMGDQSAVELLSKQMESDSRELRWAGALALGRIASHAAIDVLGQIFLQGEDDLRRAAPRGCRSIRLKGTVFCAKPSRMRNYWCAGRRFSVSRAPGSHGRWKFSSGCNWRMGNGR